MAAGAGIPSERVCFVLLTGIGDVVHGLPALNALKDDDPDRHVTWVAEPAPAQVLDAHPAVDDVVVYEKARGLGGLWELWRDLRGRAFDVALVPQLYIKSAWPALFSGAPHRVGLDRARVRDPVWIACNHLVPARPWRHTVDLVLEFVEYLGIPCPPEPRWRIAITEAEQAEQSRFFGGLPDRPVAALVLASGNPAKEWPARRHARLAEALSADFGCVTLLLAGPPERERGILRRLAERPGLTARAAPFDDVRELIWLLEGSDLVVSPDTGALQIAHALGVPVIGLYGHTNPWRVGPYSRFRELVVDRYTDPDEEPDPSRIEPRAARMERIGVEDVLERVALAFDRYVRPDGAGGRGVT